MEARWPSATVRDVTLRITKGTTPTTAGGSFTEQGVAFVKVESISDEGKVIREKLAHIDVLTHERQRRSMLQSEDILFTIAGTIGRVAKVSPDMLPANTNQAVAIVRPDRSLISPRFLYYVLRDRDRVRHARSRVVQSVQANFSLAELSGVEIPLPALAEQRAIAHVLGALDDKIELNRSMSETLEQIARTLFQAWFIDFDGVEEFAEDGGMLRPAGWGVHALDQIADFLNGAACQRFPVAADQPWLPVVKIRELHQGITDRSSSVAASIPRKWHVADGDVLFSWSGTLMVRIWTGGPAALNQHLFKVTSEDFPKWFYLRWVLHHLNAFQGVAADKATTMGHIKRHHLSDALCVVPPRRVMAQLDSTFGPLLARQTACEVGSKTLAAIRDALLPKLISGDLRIPDAERIVSEVT